MICHVTVLTEKLQETIDFYNWLLNLPVARRFKTEKDGEIAFLGMHETKLEIIYSPDYKTKPAEGGLCTWGGGCARVTSASAPRRPASWLRPR
jgi:catechol 2,3-dioxygenase-like lactoylglutathione lyase family enzyme